MQYHLRRGLAIEVGAEPIGEVADRLGFNRDLPFTWTVAESEFPTGDLNEDDAALGQSGIGERDVRATPLQMAMVAAAVANQGLVMSPVSGRADLRRRRRRGEL